MKGTITLLMLMLFSPIMVQPVLAAQQPTLHWVGCGISKKAYLVSLAKAYEKKTGIVIDVQGGGATRGIRDVANMSADMGGSCRRRIRSIAEENGVVQVPVAWDALVAIVNKDNPVSNISLEICARFISARSLTGRNWAVRICRCSFWHARERYRVLVVPHANCYSVTTSRNLPPSCYSIPPGLWKNRWKSNRVQ